MHTLSSSPVASLSRLALFVGLCRAVLSLAAAPDPLAHVDTLLGTGTARTPSALRHSEKGGTEAKPQVVPSVSPPWAMTQWVAQTRATEKKCLAPYYHEDRAIQGFRGTHWLSGSCVQDYGSVTLMPVAGPLRCRVEERASPFAHEAETARPDYYSVELPAHGVRAEMTSTVRCGLLRFTYGKEAPAHLVLQPNSDENEAEVHIDPERREVWGRNPVHRIYQGNGKPAGFSGWFVARFSAPLKAWGTFHDLGEKTGDKVGERLPGLGAYVTFDVKPGETVLVKVGTSFSGVDGARRNLDAEIPGWDFEGVRAGLAEAWSRRLGAVRVEGGAEALTKFYTALFHALQHPRVFSDVDGAYPEFAGGVRLRRTARTYYTDFSAWDTFRALHPLYHLLYPDVGADMANSLVDMAEQGGWMPIFPCWNSYTAAMIGDHPAAILADAAAKGVPGLDLERAWTYLRRNAYETPPLAHYRNGQGRRALTSYLKYNYIPLEDGVPDAFHKHEQVSRTLEYAYDDFALSRIAERLGKRADADDLARRARNYANVIDPSTGFARGRHADGRWVEPFDPHVRQKYICEGTPNHYTWFVPHDPAGLIGLLGGEAAFNARLDAHFGDGHHWHGNEPCHHIPWLYNWSGQPWKAQREVRRVLDEEYGTGPGGLSGNDDSGQMSAWYVFAALGLYPVCPGVPEYALSTPTFPSAEVKLPSGRTFRIVTRAAGQGRIYIRSMRIDGRPHERPWLSHDVLTAGGLCEVELTDRPEEAARWGVGGRPFSLSRSSR